MARATAEDVVELYSALLAEGVQLWVDGGWGIDALCGRQTRPHKDFDAIAVFEDLPALTRFLRGRGFALRVIWPENLWMPSPELPALIGREHPAVAAATAFVLEDGSGRELDFRIVRFDEHGRLVPAWITDFHFPADAFEGTGTIDGTSVRCLSAEMQMRTHTGYELEESDMHDLLLLHARFGIDYPEEFADLFSDRLAPGRAAPHPGRTSENSVNANFRESPFQRLSGNSESARIYGSARLRDEGERSHSRRSALAGVARTIPSSDFPDSLSTHSAE